jgi:hypothetical protein
MTIILETFKEPFEQRDDELGRKLDVRNAQLGNIDRFEIYHGGEKGIKLNGCGSMDVSTNGDEAQINVCPTPPNIPDPQIILRDSKDGTLKSQTVKDKATIIYVNPDNPGFYLEQIDPKTHKTMIHGIVLYQAETSKS